MPSNHPPPCIQNKKGGTQLKSGLESLSVINFFKVSEGSLNYVFPLQSEAMVTKDDFLKVIETSVDSLEGDEKKACD